MRAHLLAGSTRLLFQHTRRFGKRLAVTASLLISSFMGGEMTDSCATYMSSTLSTTTTPLTFRASFVFPTKYDCSCFPSTITVVCIVYLHTQRCNITSYQLPTQGCLKRVWSCKWVASTRPSHSITLVWWCSRWRRWLARVPQVPQESHVAIFHKRSRRNISEKIATGFLWGFQNKPVEQAQHIPQLGPRCGRNLKQRLSNILEYLDVYVRSCDT